MPAALLSPVNAQFPEGTVVNAYHSDAHQPAGPPAGDSLATATVASNVLTFPALDAGSYWAVAQVAGAYRYLGFFVQPDPPAASSQATGIAASAVRGYGTSLLFAASHLTIPSDRYLAKLARRLGALEINYGVGGTKILDPSNNTGWGMIWKHQADRLPTTAGSSFLDIRPPTQPLIILHHGVNDGGALGAQSGFQNSFAAAVEASVRMFRAAFSFRDTDTRFTYTSGWGANGTSTGRGGTSHSRNSTAGSVTFTSASNGFLGGNMNFYALVRSDTSEGWRCRAKINGGAYVTSVDTTVGYGVSGNQDPVAIPVPGVPPGQGQTVTLDFDNIGAGGVYFIGGTLTSSWPPIVAVLGQSTLPTMPPPSETQLTQAVLDAMNSSMSSIPAKFSDGRVRYVNLSSVNLLSKFYTDDVHYSPEAHAAITDLILAELAKAPALDAGYSAGPVTDLAGLGLTAGTIPDWSACPGSAPIIDASVPKAWFPKSATAGDWVGSTLA